MIVAQIVKDCRQHGRWAALGALIFSALFAFLLYSGNYRGETVLDDTFCTVAVIAFANGGLALGMALVLFDTRRGHWGFAVHRPLQRWKLFAGKVVAGGLLYLAATTLTLGIAMLLASSPRYVRAPFAVQFMIPAVFYQLQGLMWLATGLLIASRQAKWFGSRFAPAVFTFAAAVMPQAFAIHLYEGLLMVMVPLAILLIAAGAYFCHNGRFNSQPNWTRPMSGLTVLAGALGLLMLAFGLASQAFQSSRPREIYDGYRQYEFGTDGRVYRILGESNKTTAYRADNRPLSQAEYEAVFPKVTPKRVLQPTGTPVVTSLAFYDWLNGQGPRSRRAASGSFLRQSRYLTVFGTEGNNTRWSLVASRNTLEAHSSNGLYVRTRSEDGSRPLTKATVLPGDYLGTLAPDNTFDARRVPFPEPISTASSPYDRSLLAGTTRVYLWGRSEQFVREIFRLDEGGPILGAQLIDVRGETASATVYDERPYQPIDQALKRYRLAVLTRDRLYLVSPGGGPTWSVRFDPTRYSFLSMKLALLPDGMAVQAEGSDSHNRFAAELVTYRDGVETHEALPPLYGPNGLPAPEDVWHPGWAEQLFAPVTPIAMWPYAKWATPADTTQRDYWAIVVAAAAAAMGLTFRMARRDGLSGPRTVLWLILALFVGLHIPLTYLWLRERPIRVRCPACGKHRRLDADRCDRCGAAWPTPDSPATDVIDPTLRPAA